MVGAQAAVPRRDRAGNDKGRRPLPDQLGDITMEEENRLYCEKEWFQEWAAKLRWTAGTDAMSYATSTHVVENKIGVLMSTHRKTRAVRQECWVPATDAMQHIRTTMGLGHQHRRQGRRFQTSPATADDGPLPLPPSSRACFLFSASRLRLPQLGVARRLCCPSPRTASRCCRAGRRYRCLKSRC